jgi:hypothetical protein
MKFKLFIQALEKNLGYHHIPYSQDATTIQNLFDGTPVQSDFVIKFVRAVYKENSCTSLETEITKTVTEHCLAEARLTALRSKHIDIDTFNFIEDLCHAVNDIFQNESSQKDHENITEAKEDKRNKDSSKIISIEHKRHRRWLKSSA